MDIIFNEDTTLAEINKAFQGHFPFLKIQFYESKIDPIKGIEVAGDPVKNYNMSVHDLLHGRIAEGLSMNGHLKVRSFENMWHEKAGIWIQVFRKSGNIWLQTTVTDEMTLSEINRLGEEMNSPLENPEIEDIHEQE